MLKFSRISRFIWNEKPSLFVKNVPYETSLEEFQKIAPGLIQVEQPKVKYLSKQIYLKFDHLADAAQLAIGLKPKWFAYKLLPKKSGFWIFFTKANYA